MEHNCTSNKEIKINIEKTFGIRETIEGVKTILYHPGYSYEKFKHVLSTANGEQQKEFLLKLEELYRNK